MESSLLQEVMVIFGLSILVLLVCHRLHIPSIVGFLVTGLLCGPFGLGLVALTEDVQTLADMGIVLLLFSVGVEFSIKRVLKYKRFFFLGGAAQVFLTALLGFLIGYLLNRPLGEAVFLGFLLSLSSTAIVMRVLEHRQETVTIHSKVTLSMLIFQDIIAVPMMLMTPYLASEKLNLDISFLYTFGLGFVLLVAVFFAALKLVPFLMHLIARTRSRELFLLTTLCLCFSVTWITASIGLSLSLGAFLAGLIVSETEYRNEAVEDIIPFQDVFTSFFFISIGMLLDIDFLLQHPTLVLLATAGVILFKAAIAMLATFAVGMPLRTAIIVGLTLAQVGEFSFVLAQTGMESGLASPFHYQLFLAVAVLSMSLTPSLMQIAPRIAKWAQQLPFHKKIIHGFQPIQHEPIFQLSDHVVIIGFGVPGQMLASSCLAAEIPHVVIELDPSKVQQERKKGTVIYYGDATHKSALIQANVEKARAIAISINEFGAALQIIDHIRKLNKSAYLIVRVRFVEEMKLLFEHGADEVIADEYGSSVEIFTRIMQKYNIDNSMIEAIIHDKRREGYELMRYLYKGSSAPILQNRALQELGFETFYIHPESPLANKTLLESNLRQKFGITVIVITRGQAAIVDMTPETVIKVHDFVTGVGSRENLKRFKKLFYPLQAD